MDTTRLFASADFPWWIAGGLALELAIGRRIRNHADIDVLILRRDQQRVRTQLATWDCWVADPPGTLRLWPVHETLKESAHDVWCRRHPQDFWRLQLMLDESDADQWVSRRDSRAHAPLQAITRVDGNGTPYLAPHIQLFYKAKNPRAKDQLDFDAVIEAGIQIDVVWLRNAITICYGKDHPWLASL